MEGSRELVVKSHSNFKNPWLSLNSREKLFYYFLWTDKLPTSSMFLCLCWTRCKERWIFNTYLSLRQAEVTVSLKYFVTDTNSYRAQMIFHSLKTWTKTWEVTKLSLANLLSSTLLNLNSNCSYWPFFPWHQEKDGLTEFIPSSLMRRPTLPVKCRMQIRTCIPSVMIKHGWSHWHPLRSGQKPTTEMLK